MPRPTQDRDDIAGNPEAMAEAAELTRSIAATRTVDAARRKEERPALHFVPVSEGDEKAAFDSAGWLDKRSAEEAARTAARQAEENKAYRFYLKCRNPWHSIDGKPAPPHGVYFLFNAFGKTVGPKDWIATYKPTPEHYYHGDIYCQVCLKMGIERPVLPMEWVDKNQGLWRPETRWTYRSPMDVKVWEFEGDTRAGDMPDAGSNLWRDELEKRRAEAIASGKLVLSHE